ncbi:MAG: hypothetical protein DRR08_30885 [Candidatus Parabeggiatoa sp. nov. 2]|nr:MAG: hypothetical protein DRR08_30885 [Gammaproteobacteria bacterium]
MNFIPLVGIVFAVYKGLKFFEKKKLKNNSMTVKQPNPQEPPKDMVVNETEKRLQHHFQVSTISVGLAAIKQFIYSPLTPLSLGVYIYTAIPFWKKVKKSLVDERKIDGFVLYFITDIITLGVGQYFTATIGVWMFHLSRKVVTKVQDNSQKMLINVFEQQPQRVWVLKDNVEIETPLEDLKINDIIVVNTGEAIGIDGVIVDGMARIDQHALTGESQPIEKEVGDQVFAATVVVAGKICIKVEKSGQETTIAKISHILNHSTATCWIKLAYIRAGWCCCYPE